MITTPAEFTTGHHLYFDKPVKDYKEWAIQKTPVGRFYGTAQHTMKSRDPMGSKVSGGLTGMRYKYYDPEKQKEYKLRQIADRLLQKSAKTREFRRHYVPKGTELNDKTLDLALQVAK